MKVEKVRFSDDYSRMVVTTSLSADVGFPLMDSSLVRTEIKEVSEFGDSLNMINVPKLTKVEDYATSALDSVGFKLLVLADLTVSNHCIREEYRLIRVLRGVVGKNNVFISFLKDGGEITPTEPLTDYIMEYALVPEDNDDKYLVRGIYEKLKECDSIAPVFGKDARNVGLMVFSDDVLWGLEQPLDPEHFDIQAKLMDYISNRDALKAPLVYQHLSDQGSDQEELSDNNFLNVLCNASGGLYNEKLSCWEYVDLLSSHFHFPHDDLNYHFTVPDGKVFAGSMSHMRINCYARDKDSLLLSTDVQYGCGSKLHPVIVNGLSMRSTIITGTVYFLILIVLCYLIFQIIEPFVRYRFVFKKKYVSTYSGSFMTIDGRQVAQSCYYCKAPFQEGDRIVGKCDHTMHESCWEENEYHCPEYGRNCKDGSHYYNKKNLLDPKNALYYWKWIFAAILAAMSSWLLFNALANEAESLLEFLLCKFYNLDMNDPKTSDILDSCLAHYYRMPRLALAAGFSLTFAMSILVLRAKSVWKRLLDCLLRSVVVGILGYMVFFFDGIICTAVDVLLVQNIMGIISFALLTLMIYYASTVRTRIKPNKIWLVIAMVLGFVSLIASYILLSRSGDYRLIVIITYIVYCVSFAIGLAHDAPRSENYFLRVEGPTKPVSIALYKWFRNDVGAVVNIGRSPRCEISMSWDLESSIAPVQASIKMDKGVIRLTVVEGSVRLKGGKALKERQTMRLYDKTFFEIGETRFTYEEADIERKSREKGALLSLLKKLFGLLKK